MAYGSLSHSSLNIYRVKERQFWLSVAHVQNTAAQFGQECNISFSDTQLHSYMPQLQAAGLRPTQIPWLTTSYPSSFVSNNGNW